MKLNMCAWVIHDVTILTNKRPHLCREVEAVGWLGLLRAITRHEGSRGGHDLAALDVSGAEACLQVVRL